MLVKLQCAQLTNCLNKSVFNWLLLPVFVMHLQNCYLLFRSTGKIDYFLWRQNNIIFKQTHEVLLAKDCRCIIFRSGHTIVKMAYNFYHIWPSAFINIAPLARFL